MKNILINIILVIVFTGCSVFILIPLFSEIEFTQAKGLALRGAWDKSEEHFVAAIKTDPFNARYFYGYSESLLTESQKAPKNTMLLRKAEGLCTCAVSLNPVSGEYAARLGQIELAIDKKDTAGAFVNFRKALSLDPSGFNVAYTIGYSSLSSWVYMDGAQKRIVLERLKRAIAMQPAYGYNIYLKLWNNTSDFKYLAEITPDGLNYNESLYDFIKKNELWQFRKMQAAVVSSYLKKEDPKAFITAEEKRKAHIKNLKEKAVLSAQAKGYISISDWHGTSDDGRNKYKDGGIYWPGTVDAVINLPKGESVLTLQAKGTSLNGIYPYMIVKLDGEEVGEIFVADDDWKEYEFPVKSPGGVSVFSVTFANDAIDAGKNEDRNLFVGSAEIKIKPAAG